MIISAMDAANVAMSTAPTSPMFQAASEICVVRGQSPWDYAPGVYGHLNNAQRVIMETLLTTSLIAQFQS